VPPPGTVSVVVSRYRFGWSGDHSATSSRSVSDIEVTVVPGVSAGSIWVVIATVRTGPVWSVSTASSWTGPVAAWALSIVAWMSTRRPDVSTSAGCAYTSDR
jgi:hypothetical protein